LPAVMNECLLQSYSGVIRLFPNTTNLGPVQFRHLRAAGAFLVSAAWDGKRVSGAEILSERGRTARFVDPWPNHKMRVSRADGGQEVVVRNKGEMAEFETRPGERYQIEVAD
ncbi:MAG: glycoside hydrolase family 95-like protein, partial [Bryobacteraceae bacterium]